MLIVRRGGLLQALNSAARESLPALRVGEIPVGHGPKRDAFLRYLDCCATTGALVPGAVFLEGVDGVPERHTCLGARARLRDMGEGVSVLLHLDGAAFDRRFKVLSGKLHDARRIMQERRRRARQMQALLEERGRLLGRLEEDAAARQAAERERDTVLNRLYRAGQDERRRLARDLHDHAGQHLVALNFGLRRLTSRLADPKAKSEIDQLLRQAQDIEQALRRVTLELRPAALDEFGVVTALRHLVGEWGRTTGVATEFQLVGPEAALSTEVAITLYRLTQEALTNVAKHAGEPSGVSVVLLFGLDHLTLTVDDDGIGFEADDASSRALVAQGKLGLIGMRERMALVGGSLELESAPGRGTTVMARIRLVEDASEDV
ncbi:sensor histidine kinase [Methylobacterium sp. M6A4_1b]